MILRLLFITTIFSFSCSFLSQSEYDDDEFVEVEDVDDQEEDFEERDFEEEPLEAFQEPEPEPEPEPVPLVEVPRYTEVHLHQWQCCMNVCGGSKSFKSVTKVLRDGTDFIECICRNEKRFRLKRVTEPYNNTSRETYRPYYGEQQ